MCTTTYCGINRIVLRAYFNRDVFYYVVIYYLDLSHSEKGKELTELFYHGVIYYSRVSTT